MQLPSHSILLLTKQPGKIHILVSLLQDSRFAVAIATSEAQAAQQVEQSPPFLIILAGDHQAWSPDSLHQLRHQANSHHITLVALSDFHAPSWVHQDENPCFDGFLVNPISYEILLSLVQSAHTRQMCSLVA
jgi:CheY-like chemotaxis protein